MKNVCNMCVGICGLGVVGSAVFDVFKERGVNVVGYDKYKNGGVGKIDTLLNTDILFLCLPTPYSKEERSYDKSSLHDVCTYLSSVSYQGLVVVKSTVEPKTSSGLQEKYGLHIVHNPEFLTAKTAKQDFDNQSHIVIGGEEQYVNILSDFYRKYWPDVKQSLCTREESEMMKLGVNCFYATKIQFFNELYTLARKIGADYNVIRSTMLKNNWISHHHTDVPGPDGQMSYGGMCFPKDTNALFQAMLKEGTHCKVIEAVIKERDIMRDD